MFVSKDGDVQTLPAGKPGTQVEKRRYVMIGKDGKRGRVVASPSKSANQWRNQPLEAIAAALHIPPNQ